MNKEIWRPVPIDGLREKYEVSNLGNLRSIPRTIISNNRHGKAPRTYDRHLLKFREAKGGYYVVTLRPGEERKSRTYFIHRLVALAFIPNPSHLPVVDHIDTDRKNNIASNLRWCTYKENSLNPITRQHLTDAMIGNQRSKGITRTEECRKKISEAHTGKSLPEDVRKKISATLTGRKVDEERRLKSCKPIAQYTPEGELVKIWPSATDAARSMGLGWSNILRCANPNTKNRTAGGFVWKHIK